MKSVHSSKIDDPCPTLWVSRVLKYPKKCLEDLITFFMSTWWGDSKNMKEIEFSPWFFEGRLRQCKNVLPDGLNWLWLIVCATLQVAQKSTVRIQFLKYFWNPLIKYTWKSVTKSIYRGGVYFLQRNHQKWSFISW